MKAILLVLIPSAPESNKGDNIQSKPSSQKFEEGWDRIFGQKTSKPSTLN